MEPACCHALCDAPRPAGSGQVQASSSGDVGSQVAGPLPGGEFIGWQNYRPVLLEETTESPSPTLPWTGCPFQLRLHRATSMSLSSPGTGHSHFSEHSLYEFSSNFLLVGFCFLFFPQRSILKAPNNKLPNISLIF